MASPSALFQPLKVGSIDVKNRIFMAPMTRGRAKPKTFVPTPMMIEYYRQRSGSGLIISEATGISVEGTGWVSIPGIWSDEQVEGWKPVTEAVHAAGGKIVLQLWHMGRMVHPDFLDGQPPVSPSVSTAPAFSHTPNGKKPYEPSRALSIDEIPRVVADYRHAAANAKRAGFDGVQLHGANGYLPDQFLRDGTNFRTDEYGGCAENRARFLREVLSALVDVWGAGSVSVRLSPNGEIQGCDDSDPATTFAAAARVCEELKLGFVELRQPGPDSTFMKTDVPKLDAMFRSIYKGPLVLNSDYTAEEAEADVASGRCEAVAFGRPYICNPDLDERIRVGAAWAIDTKAPGSWYSTDAVGYTDYPTMAEEAAAGGDPTAPPAGGYKPVAVIDGETSDSLASGAVATAVAN